MPSDVFDFELFDDFLEVGHDPNHKRSGKSRWGDAAFRGLLERVSQFDEPGLAARHSGKGHAEGRGIFREIERYDDRRIARSRSNVGAGRSGKQESIELVRL